MKAVRDPRHRPAQVQLAVSQPEVFGQNRVSKDERDRHSGGGIERYVEAAHRSGSHVDGQRQPGSAKGVTLVFIDDEHVELSVIDLHKLQGQQLLERRTPDRFIPLPGSLCAKPCLGRNFRVKRGQTSLHAAEVGRFELLLGATPPDVAH